jgi:hypothetical protein
MTLANTITGSIFTKSLLAAAAAAALLLAAPAKSDAQVFVGARIGRPAQVVVVAHPNRYEIERRETIARRNAEIRHQESLRAHRYDRYRYDRDHDRNGYR